jgi:hypothetical protein
MSVRAAEVLGGDLRPDFRDRVLDLGAHLPVVDADAAGFCRIWRVPPLYSLRREEPLHLLDAALVGAGRLHDLVEDRNVERHDRDRGAGLGDEGFVDGDEGAAAAVGP